jgi:hypothetical protein
LRWKCGDDGIEALCGRKQGADEEDESAQALEIAIKLLSLDLSVSASLEDVISFV